MTHRNPTAWMYRALWLSLALLFVACTHGAQQAPEEEDTGTARSAAFTNGGFEAGAAGMVPPAPWTLQTFLNPNPNGVTNQSPQTRAGLNLVTQGTACTTNAQCNMSQFGTTCQGGFCRATSNTITLNGANQPDPNLGVAASLRWPRYGSQCALVNQLGKESNVNSLSQSMTIGAADVDPTDNKVHVRFVVAPVLEDPAHLINQQPYFFVSLTNVTQANAVLYTNFNFSNQAGVPWKSVVIAGPPATTYRYTDWQLVDIAPGSPAINQGDTVKLELIASGCSLGGHMGELYVDGVGTGVPGLYVSGTGPAQANPGTNITYNLSYKNGSGSAETGAVIDFTTPPGTTFQSITPPAGATCVTPSIGMAGTIVCTFTGPIPAGGAGAFSVTVNINPATTGVVTCGTYDIHSTQETPLLGNKIDTEVGCVLDADCPAGNWCKEAAPSACTPTLANGTVIPTDAPHMGPTLSGLCTAAAATLVCASGVCDPTDNKCGLLNGDGTCTAATGVVVCRSLVCDVDGKCGYLVGDGPCTVATGGVVCRSGACSTNGKCEPAGGCNVDADCSGGNWCNETTHACTPKLANGTAMPTDGLHMGPTLDGTCTAAAATLVCAGGVCDPTDNKCGLLNGDGSCTVATGDVVCRSGVCDTDGKCGLLDGDGPCTMATGGVVCRSGACSNNGLCEPAGGCNVDADCAGGNWCNETSHTCTPTLVNGTALPTDGAHAGPTLDGTCTAAAGALVCTSGVCDVADNQCGYANGDGPCTVATGGTVCRSGACSTNGLCEPDGGCNVDADCGAGVWCNETMHMCLPQVANGMPVPSDAAHLGPTLDGTCGAAAGALTCQSGVCDPSDNKCGFANGDGPCTDANSDVVCRSAICATSGPKVGDCVACVMDSQCPGASAICDLTTNTCVQCTDDSMCSGATPVCDTASSTCVPCDGDSGSASAHACGAGEPFCFLTGTMAGDCGKCAMDADCQGHAGNVCDTTTGLCISACHTDADCTTSQWCDAAPSLAGMCQPKLDNGKPLPSSPTDVSTCGAAVGARVCTSGVCDTADNTCGYANGDGPCTSDDQCRDKTCDPAKHTCSPPAAGCKVDDDCPTGDFCKGNGTCSPKLPNGSKCDQSNACISGDCEAGVCNGLVPSGNGLICAVGEAGGAGGDATGLLGLAVAAAGIVLRRRRRG